MADKDSTRKHLLALVPVYFRERAAILLDDLEYESFEDGVHSESLSHTCE
jgi:hypothetical protein